MARFEGIDFYDLDSLFTEEERMIRDTVRAFVEDRVMPIIGEAYIERKFPKQLIPELGELGVYGANLPEKYGCAGLNNVSYGLIMQELERGDSGIRSFTSVQGALVMYPIFAFGSEEHRTEWLPKLATGEAIGCFGLTEPDYGSDPGGMITTAKQTSDGWLLNGGKMWITNGSMADVAIIWAQTRELGDVKGIRGFVVPTNTPGFSSRDQKGKLSLLASDTSEIVLQDVELPESAVMPESEAMLMIDPRPFDRMEGTTAFATSKLPRTLTAMTLSHSPELISVNGIVSSDEKSAALLTSILILPSFSSVRRTNSLTDSGSVTSSLEQKVVPPTASSDAWTAPVSATSPIATFAPALARASA